MTVEKSALQLPRKVHSFYGTSTGDVSELFVGMRRSLIAEIQEYAAQRGARGGEWQCGTASGEVAPLM
jgi:hypothetical protein